MDVKTYHISCFALFVVLLLGQWFCVAVVLTSWVFQIAHIVLTYCSMKIPSKEGTQERFGRNFYAESGVSILKPLCGTRPTLYENLRSYFTLEYPMFELIFCVADEQDAALEVVERLRKEFPDVSTLVSFGTQDVGINPKICNVSTGYSVANHTLIWMADDNVVASDAALQDMVNKCVDGARLVHQVPWSLSGPNVEATLGSMSCGSILERWYFAAAHGRPYTVINNVVCTCLNGMSNMFSKKHLDELGGLARFGNTLNEDGEIGFAFDRHGYPTSISNHAAIQNVGAIDVSQYVERRVRWTRIRNKYGKTKWTAPFELVVDSHVVSLCCLGILVHYHGAASAWVMPLHQAAWLLVDATAFMLMDKSVALPKSWENHSIDWGRVSKTTRGVYFYLLNALQHYGMWVVREYITVYVRILSLIDTDNIVWKDNEIPIDDDSAEEEEPDKSD